jgi:hypothetical protein
MGFDLIAKKPTSEEYSDFRFNVWGWRLPWNYICHFAHDELLKNKQPVIIDESICQGGGYNDGTLISSEQANKIAEIIFKHDKDGTLDELEDTNRNDRLEADRINKEIDNQMAELKKQVEKEIGSGIAPADYPEKYYKKFKELQNKRDWRSYYRFHKESMLSFAEFMKQSGGFEIW